MCPNYDIINEDEFEDGEADRSDLATPLPPDSYSPQEMFHNEDEFDDGDADRSGHATPFPPKSYCCYKMIHSFSNISEHSTFGSLLKVNSRCKGS
jgi:hypothetical protein